MGKHQRPEDTLVDGVEAYRDFFLKWEFSIKNPSSGPERTLAAWLFASRRILGIQQKTLSDKTGIGQTVLSKIERGTRKMDSDTAALLAQHIGPFHLADWKDW